MTRYIGLDAHAESCTIAVLGGSGKRLRHERFQTSAELPTFSCGPPQGMSWVARHSGSTRPRASSVASSSSAISPSDSARILL